MRYTAVSSRSVEKMLQLTLMASSAKGLQFTHHWGLRTGSMTSPDLLVSEISTDHVSSIERQTCKWEFASGYPLSLQRVLFPSASLQPQHVRGTASCPIQTHQDQLAQIIIQLALNSGPALSFSVPSSFRILINLRLCRTPTS